MACSSCGHKTQNVANVTVKAGAKAPAPQPKTPVVTPLMAGKSTGSKLVKLRYYGGGMSAKREGTGCKTCGGGRSRYSVVTKEQIMFVSEDAPNGLYKETVSVGHDYYVTEEQAKVMLQMTYRDAAGKVKNKFKEIE